MPFYQWNQGAVTQLYHITPECNLQLIVHPDGSTTMQTIASQQAAHPEQVVETQKAHCAHVKAIHQRLKENWFIFYDYQESAPAESLFSTEAWLGFQDNAWAKLDAKNQEASTEAVGVRENARHENQKVMRKQ